MDALTRSAARHAACMVRVTSASGHSKPRARLRRAQRERRRCIHHRRSHLCVSGTRCALLRRLPPRVAVSQSHAAAVRGKWASPIQHNRALVAAAPVVRSALLVGRPRIMGGYVLRPYRLPHARCCHACSKDSRCARAKKPRQHMRLVTRCAPLWCVRARYARGQPDSPSRHHRRKLPPLPRSGGHRAPRIKGKGCARPEEAGPPLTRLCSVLWGSGQRRSPRVPGNPGERP